MPNVKSINSGSHSCNITNNVHWLNDGGLELVSYLPAQPLHRTPLLFVHGAFTNGHCWAEHYLPWFAERGWRSYAISLSGHGNSAGRERLDSLGIQDYCNDVRSAVCWLNEQQLPEGDYPPTHAPEALSASATALIGHSMGGFVVHKYLSQYSGIAAVVHMCSMPPQGLWLAQMNMLLKTPGLMFELRHAFGGRNMPTKTTRAALFSQPIDETSLRRLSHIYQPESLKAMWDMLQPDFCHWFNAGNAPEQTPTLVLGAGKDKLVPVFLVHALARHLGRSAHIFEDMGHALTHERDWPMVTTHIETWLCQTLEAEQTEAATASSRS